MNKLSLISTFGVAAAVVPGVAQAKAANGAEKKPLNVILIMSDDQGYGDVGYTGNPNINTPELDKLCSESICFDNFHTGTTSAPTRSGLMTGMHGNSTGVWHTIGGRSIMNPELYTMAEAFQDSGYATAMYGKWHLGDNYPYRPADRGFEDVLWHKGGGVGQTPDYWGNTYFEDTYFRGKDTPEKQSGYCTDIWFNETERFITESLDKEKPFFCYLALNAPHGPYHVDERWVAPYRGNKDVVIPQFYGMISNIDYNVGKLRSLLERLEVDDNTVLIFLGDNGSAGGVAYDKMGYMKRGYNGGLRGTKGTVYEGGHRQAMLMHVPGVRPTKTQELATNYDIMPTLIDLCSLTPKREVKYDGVNILSPESRKGRVGIVDTQREEFLKKDKMYCVMKDDWRLLAGKNVSLYDMSNDREQRVNVAAKYPEVVKELMAEYTAWWDKTSKDSEVRFTIPLETDVKGESVTLCCHDIHDLTNGTNVWNFTLLHRGDRPTPGFWSVNVPKARKYDIAAYRWSPESGLNLDAPAPQGRKIPNGTSYAAGAAIKDLKSAKLIVNDKVIAEQKDFPTDTPAVMFKDVKLPQGDHSLTIDFTDSSGKVCSAG